ncbi:MAG: hypothetical protein EOP22_13770 [Hyphomicrobiales bacterium]|nr:MAG: hypothetical protein EOP22_13770 [Hyphomicrobiales bacterium]
MLIFIGSRRQTYVLRHMQRDERMPAWTCRTYAWLFRTRRFPAGTYIFTAVDRLDAGERRLAALFYRHLNAQGGAFRALNDPAIAMGRYRLLRTLHEAGLNDFNAYLATEQQRPSRYPVFIRRASSSIAPLTGLLRSADELEANLARLIAAGEAAEDLIIIEYCAEEAAPGIFIKQSEYRVGDRYVPNGSQFSAGWYVKRSTHIEVPESYHHADTALIAANPYADVAARAFAIAGIEYGRADIGMVGGRPQIYEINFNPELTTQRERPRPHPMHSANWDRSDDLLFEAMHAIDTKGKGSVGTIGNAELLQFRLRFWRNYAPQRY